MSMRELAAAAALVALTGAAAAQSPNLGKSISPEDLATWDISISPDGAGLPPGSGTPKQGEEVFAMNCQACHNAKGAGQPNDRLVGGQGTIIAGDKPAVKTVGSYWPYATTLFDYIRRAMPFGDAESLTNDELYAVVAYVLNLNDIVDDKFVLSRETWGTVKMPNEGGFFDDDREKTEKAFWNPNPCMKDCRGPMKITGRARAIDVTPDEKTQKRGVE